MPRLWPDLNALENFDWYSGSAERMSVRVGGVASVATTNRDDTIDNQVNRTLYIPSLSAACPKFA